MKCCVRSENDDLTYKKALINEMAKRDAVVSTSECIEKIKRRKKFMNLLNSVKCKDRIARSSGKNQQINLSMKKLRSLIN